MVAKKQLIPFETRLRKTGSAAGVTIPADFLRSLGYEVGDTLRVAIDGDGLQIRKVDPEFDAFTGLYSMVEDRFLPALKQLYEHS